MKKITLLLLFIFTLFCAFSQAEKEVTKNDSAKTNSIKKQKDSSNYTKLEIIQYSDITGIKNDNPNGLLQYQGMLKIPISHVEHILGTNTSVQWFRSAIIDATLNRIDKSKSEIDYKYTNFIYQGNVAKKSSSPWLATTDIWRYSNFQAGFRLVPVVLNAGDFRIQLQTGIKIIKNLPYSEDSIKSGPDSGKVKSDFRSIYSNVKFIEVFMRTMSNDKKMDISLNLGVMWLRLMDSYYKQIEIHQQDPFNRFTALSTVSDTRRNKPMWYTSFRLGYMIGEEKVVTTFIRLNFMVQTGKYLSPLSNIVDNRPVVFEEKKFYNNFFQLHLGTTIELGKLFKGKESEPADPNKEKDKSKKLAKEDGPISNSL